MSMVMLEHTLREHNNLEFLVSSKSAISDFFIYLFQANVCFWFVYLLVSMMSGKSVNAYE